MGGVFAAAHRLFSSCFEQGLLFVAARGLLISVASPAVSTSSLSIHLLIDILVASVFWLL